MLKNILLPILLIVLTSVGTIYFWFEDAPLSFFGLIGFLTLGVGSMYISYYLFYKLFPDKRNIALPNLTNILSLKGKAQVFTVGSLLGGFFAMLLTGVGVFSWTVCADKYQSFQLEKYGRDAKALIIGQGHSKGIGTYREYEYLDNSGKIYKDKFANQELSLGDTIQVRFSTARPKINQVIFPANEN